MDTSRPRIARMRLPRCGSLARSTEPPSVASTMEPLSSFPGGLLTSRSTLSAVTLLPHPLSPTTPSVSFGATLKLTPSTARTTPSSVWK